MSSTSPAVDAYLKRKAEALIIPQARTKCLRCRKPATTCYCANVAPIDPSAKIVILMHPVEERHPVGTGRMAHQCLKNSHMFVGIEFDEHAQLNALLDDPRYSPLLMFPGPKSVNLTLLSEPERASLIEVGRIPLVIVLDGTWHHAKKMLHLSPKLQKLARICFSLDKLSGFIVRKQPHPHCFSTIEAIHEVINLLGSDEIKVTRAHDILLEVFSSMVNRQLEFRSRQDGRHRAGFLARKARRIKHRATKAQSSTTV